MLSAEARKFVTMGEDVGGMLDLGAVLKIRDKKMGPGWDPTQNMIYGPEKCAESIAMMIYYCQGTGCSLSSQYSLQESILKK